MPTFWRIVLAVLNFLGFIFFFMIFLFALMQGVLTWPFVLLFIMAVLALTSGIMVLKRKNWRWGIIGIIFLLGVVIYNFLQYLL